VPENALKVLLLVLAACGSPLELRGDLAPMHADAETLAADYLPALDGWRVIVEAESFAFVCAGELSIGCTALSVQSQLAHVRLAMADGWPLSKTSFRHELTHVWLAATTGDGDPNHAHEVWQ
jgi:hypothetical protein